MYDLGHALPVEGVRDVPGGTSILVSGPPGTGKRDLAVELRAGSDGTEFRVLGLDGVDTRDWRPVNR